MNIPTKFCHDHKTKFTHANMFSHIHHEHIPISQTHSFHNANTPKIQTKVHPTTSLHCQNSKSHQHYPNCTMIKEKTHFKNVPKPTFQTWSIIQCPQNFRSGNISPWNFQWNMQQHFSKQRNQRKTHLGVHMTIWSMGPRVLKKSIIIILIKCWIIFVTMRS